ncbi:hypothetical protein [Extensimonas perlucida]|uniref:O-linked N-acetylglucosamine transferase family protein n=1 Tax=Extensimonas perlucida TaxID=2590786 RepID=UPI0011A747E8|nr:hypothetical protein [Extensimonas perlucida]
MNDNDLQKLAALIGAGKPELAVKGVDKLLPKHPQDARLHILKADALKRVGNREGAARAYKRAGELGGAYGAVGWAHAGMQYQMLKQQGAAVDAYRRSLALNENQLDTQNNLCVLLYEMNQVTAAMPHARWLVKNSTQASHFINAGYVFRKSGLQDEALAAFMKALELAPDDWRTLSVVLQAAQHGCEWALVDDLIERLQREIYATGRGEETFEMHLVHVSWCMNEAWNLQMCKGGARRSLEGVKLRDKPFDHSKHRWGERLRIGYVSADFHNHAILHLMGGVFAHHDRSKVEVFAYDHAQHDTSYFRKRFETSVEHLVDIRKMTDIEAAERIYADQIDILIDLQGFTEKNRLPIFAMRPAPIQVTYLGFPGQSGMDCLDYVIADPVVTPDSSKPHYTEKLCRLPESYQCNDNERIIANNPMTRSEFGLPENGIVFCTFNQPYKIDRITFETWMSVLREVPGSVMWILDPGEVAGRNLRKAAEAQGVAAERIVFADKMVPPLHLARLQLADMCLDTRVYNGHTITSDCLWAGIPVVTAPGTHFASRVAASLLRACDMPELIADDLPGMARLAIEIAQDPERLAALKAKIRHNRFIAPLFDTERITRHLEAAYALMAERGREGLAPDHIDVPPLPRRTEPFMTALPTKHTAVNNNRSDLEALRKGENVLQLPQNQCPLCQHDKADVVREVQWAEAVGGLDKAYWVQCKACQHVFSRYYWNQEGRAALPARTLDFSSERALARGRAAETVRAVVAELGGMQGLLERKEPAKWVDVYADTPWTYAVALEYGFAMTGIVRQEADEALLKTVGGVVARVDFLGLNINGTADVISLLGCLEKEPYPEMYIDRAISLLAPGGALVLRFANVASALWRINEKDQPSTLWQEVERQHLFSMIRLAKLLQAKQFRIAQALPDPDVECGMVLIATKEKRK